MQDVQHIKPVFGQLVIEHNNKYSAVTSWDGNGMRVMEAGVPFGSLSVYIATSACIELIKCNCRNENGCGSRCSCSCRMLGLYGAL